MITGIPLIGDVDRSAPITQAEPRRKVNGDAAMRPMRNGMRSFCLPLLFSAMSFNGSGRSFEGIHSAWDSRGTVRRKSLPSACRFCHGTTLWPKSLLGSGSIFAIAIVPSRSVIDFT